MSSQTYLTLGSVVGWLAAALIVVAFFADWTRQRLAGLSQRRCPKCWYDMSHTPGLTCSECGYAAKRERKLFKAQKRWKLVWLAVLMLIGSYALRVTPDVKARGWVAAVPTTALVAFASADGNQWALCWGGFPPEYGPSPMVEELAVRLDAGRLWRWQWRVLASRYMSHNPKCLDRLVYTRATWPVGVPIEVRLSSPSICLSNNYGVVLRARVAGTDGPWVEESPGTRGRERLKLPAVHQPQDAQFEIQVFVNAKLVRDQNGLTIDVDRSREALAWSGVCGKTKIVESMSDVMLPQVSESANKTVRRSNPSLLRLQDGSVRLQLPHSNCRMDPAEPSWALGALVEVSRDDNVVATGEVIYQMGEPNTLGGCYLSCCVDYDLNWRVEPPDSLNDHQWAVHMRGEPAIALGDFRRNHYWSGDVTIPITSMDYR